MMSSLQRSIAIVVLIAAAAVSLFFHKHLQSVEEEKHLNNIKKWRQSMHTDLFGEAGQRFIEEISAQNIEQNLIYLTSRDHVAGTKQDLEQAEYIKDVWTKQGLDQVFLQPYNVQLSHPDLTRPNKVYVLDEQNQIKFTSTYLEDSVDGTSFDDSFIPAFLAYSPAGTVVSKQLVYVNYGRYEDFQRLESLGISVKDCLVIIRLGQIFRGDKINNAQMFEASGVILYTDPCEYHLDHGTSDAYPHSYWLPGSGIQRGSLLIHDGDPTTPLYPAINGAYRVPDENTDTPKIPAHVLSYNDARKLLVQIGGSVAPEEWQGTLNMTYRLGPQLITPGWSVKLEVNNVKHVVTTYNVIGVINGLEEPDRYIILGNHRDAWSFGSIDPSSGTAAQMELTRSLGLLRKQAWQPRRSIVVGSWGAGEYGFFGATEWIEEYLKIFEQRAVAYLNVDMAITFPYNLLVSATPLLHNVIIEATKKVPGPDDKLGFTTLWDHWSSRVRSASPAMIDYNLASISDHAPFYQRIGVPSSYMLWKIKFDEKRWSDYPLYHTMFEDFNAVKNILDPEFKYHRSIAQLWGLMAIGLADNIILPMNPEDETIMMYKLIKEIKDVYGPLLDRHNISLRYLEDVVLRYSDSAVKFNMRIQNLTSISELQARQINDQLILLEKCFIDDEGISLRPYLKNVIFGTSTFNQYKVWLAPGLREALYAAENCSSKSSLCQDEWENVKHQLGAVITAVNSAVIALRDYKLLI